MPWIKIPFDRVALDVVELPDSVNDVSAWLDKVHELLECEWIEVACTSFTHLALVVDDCAKLKDGWEEKINPLASALYPSPYDEISGHALLCRRCGSDLVPLTDFDVQQLRSIFRDLLTP